MWTVIRPPSPCKLFILSSLGWLLAYLKTLKHLKTSFRSGLSVTDHSQACNRHSQLHHSIIGLHKQRRDLSVFWNASGLWDLSQKNIRDHWHFWSGFFKVKSKAKLPGPCFMKCFRERMPQHENKKVLRSFYSTGMHCFRLSGVKIGLQNTLIMISWSNSRYIHTDRIFPQSYRLLQ